MLILPPPDGPVIALMMLLIVAKGASTKWVHLGLENALPVGLARVVGEAVMVSLVLLTVHGYEDLTRVPLAQLAGETTVAVILLVWLRRLGHRMPVVWRPDVFVPVFRRALPIVGHSLLGLMIYNADLIFLRFLRDETSVGFYAAAYTLLSFLNNVGVMYSFSLLPTLTRLETGSAEERGLYQTAQAQVFAVGLPVAVGGYLVAQPLMTFVFGEGYEPSAVALSVLIATVPIGLLRVVAMAGLIARDRHDLLFNTTLYATPLNLVLNALLIPEHGIWGAAVATLITEVVRAALALWYTAQLGLSPAGPTRLWRSALAAAAMAGAVVALPTGRLEVAIPAGAVAYAIALSLLGGIRFGGRFPRLAV